MGRPPCCDKSNVKKGLWTEEEDLKLIAYTNTHGVGNWTSVPKKAGLKRCGKSCRLRWTNYLRPNLKHESFTPQEEERIITLHAAIGSRWSIIANHLPGRTDNDIKNHWNTKLSKKLCQQGIDPVTHKPISQIMHSIGALSSTGTRNLNINQLYQYQTASLDGRVSCLSRDLKNVFLSKPVPVAAAVAVNPVPFTYEGSSSNIDQVKPFSITPAGATLSNEGSSSSSSIAAFQDDDQDLKWSAFLLDDVLLSSAHDDGSYNAQTTNNTNRNMHECGKGELEFKSAQGYATMGDEEESSIFGALAPSSSASFVDAILDQERDLMLEFPEFISEYPDNLL